MILIDFFSWYFSLFGDVDPKVKIGAWAATVATLTFVITFIIKPSRNYILSKIKKLKPVNKSSFADIYIKYSFDELKNIIRIILIDDEDIFPVTGFRQFGYNIEHWIKLDTNKLKLLHDGMFDIIILDIMGVAKDIASNDGLDVLQDLKNYNPSQVVVAYSGQSFNFSMNKFWELADEKLSKPTPFIGTQAIIDNLIERTFTVEYFKDKLVAILRENNISSELLNIENLFVHYKSINSEPDWKNEMAYLKVKSGEKNKISSTLKTLFKYCDVKR